MFNLALHCWVRPDNQGTNLSFIQVVIQDWGTLYRETGFAKVFPWLFSG